MSINNFFRSSVLTIFVLAGLLFLVGSVSAQTCTDPNISVGAGQTCSTVINIITAPATINVSTGGSISPGSSAGVDSITINNSGSTTISNYGTIESTDSNGYSAINISAGSRVTLTNYSTAIISGQPAISNSGTIDTLSNLGNINVGDGSSGIYNDVGAHVGDLNNSGYITAGANGYGVINYGWYGSGFGSIDNLTNSGWITVGPNGAGIWGQSGATIASLTNSNSIVFGDQANGIWNHGGVINSLVNTGSISISTGFGYGVLNDSVAHFVGRIDSIDNSGSITAGVGGYGIYNDGGTIGRLNNAQGGNSSTAATTALTYWGALPTNYNIIINSADHYGQLAVSAVSGGLTFGVDSSSILSAQTYLAVLSGLTSSNITNYSSIFNTWTNFNSSYKWELVSGSNSTTWNLLVASLAPPSSNITLAGSPYYTANLGTTVNPVFDGGTLKVSAAGSVTQAFTITANNGTIDQNSVASNFTGNITNSGAGVNGKLTIVNSGSGGSVALSGNNTYSGGTEVQAGANLSISSANNIGSGTLALVGSSTIPATLTTTASMTLNNQLTVSGDPVFNVASGTTTTISSPITNGVTAGDVVVEGGGILALTAANTYTGLTSITAGSTLALSGAGLIAASSNVTNNGTFNIAGKTSNVSVASYTQGTTGTLAMGIAPSNTPKLNVAGVASLAGGLSLTASSGSYAPGKYTLLTANGGVTGSFGNVTTNLSSYTRLGYGLAYDANDVYLIFTPNVADTQQSLVNTASALQNIYTLQNSVLANSFSYDCNEFGANGVCISVGGRNTAVSAANGLNNTSGLLIAAYRPHPNYRMGAYVDQNLSVNNAGSTVNLGNNTPLIGLFGAWNERVDGTGTEVKVSAAYGQKNTTINRQVVGTSEAGSGSSQLNSQGAQVTAKYGFGVVEHVIVAPYVGIRYTQNNMGGYTEGTSATVTAPLTYSALNTNATTALAGLGASYRFIPQAGVFGSAGVETDTNTANGTYSATGLTGLTPINFNANPVKTRPTATIGAYYDVEKNQRVGVTGIYRQEPFQAVQTTTVMATYTVGL
jgi:autotransporter-associated beta strand protein